MRRSYERNHRVRDRRGTGSWQASLEDGQFAGNRNVQERRSQNDDFRYKPWQQSPPRQPPTIAISDARCLHARYKGIAQPQNQRRPDTNDIITPCGAATGALQTHGILFPFASMKRLWLLFTQVVTVLLGIYFVVATLQPSWLQRNKNVRSNAGIALIEAPKDDSTHAAVATSSFSPAAKKAAPAVVSINTSTEVRHPRANDPWFQFFFGDQGVQNQAGLGSGVIISPDGYVLTNNHVVEAADDIEVTLTDGRKSKAQVIGTDPETDLAILKITLDKLPVIVLGNSESVEVGDQVLAIGNPFGVGQTVTSGIISALGRSELGINTFENFIQTDAAINPGNSGGALVDVNGNLVGINTAIYSRSGGSMGIGFAIPVAIAKNVLDSIVRDGKVTRGWIGVEPNDLTPELAETFGVKADEGVIITGVLQNGPAAQAGIRPGDVITQVGEKPVRHVQELLTAVAGLMPGTEAQMQIRRNESSLTIRITPDTRPASGRAVPQMPHGRR